MNFYTRNNSGIKDSQNMLKTDDHDASCRNNQMLRDVLGRDGPNDSELEDYFNKQRSKHVCEMNSTFSSNNIV